RPALASGKTLSTSGPKLRYAISSSASMPIVAATPSRCASPRVRASISAENRPAPLIVISTPPASTASSEVSSRSIAARFQCRLPALEQAWQLQRWIPRQPRLDEQPCGRGQIARTRYEGRTQRALVERLGIERRRQEKTIRQQCVGKLVEREVAVRYDTKGLVAAQSL